MKTKSLFFSSLIAAAAMSTVPALAENITLSNGEKTTLTITSGTTGSGNTYSYATPSGTDKGGWLWLGSLGGTSNVAFGTSESQMALSGTGIIAVGYQGGNWGTTYNFNFTTTDASEFFGKFAVVNEWDNDTVVKLSGEGWSNVEYVSGGVSREQSWATLRSYANSGRAMDKLELQGATTLAGITGVSKGYSYGSVSNVNSKEFVTANTTGTVLTLAGAGTYSYYGSVGTSSASISLEKTGAGTQTFGGAAKYLSSVNVSAGALALTEGTVTISGDATVANGASLDLSGATVTLSKAISNSGTVTVNSSTVFVLVDALKTEGDNTYKLITNEGSGSITGWNSETLSRVNFRLGTSELTARSTVTVSSSGVVVVNNVAEKTLTWGGAATGPWDTTTTNTPWNDGANAEAFYTGDKVIFNTASANITVSGTVTPTAMTVSATTTLSGTGTVSVAAANLTTSATLTLDSGVTLDLGSGAGVSIGQNLAGTGTVSFNSTSHGTTINFGEIFAGTVNLSGSVGLNNHKFGANTATVSITGTTHLWSPTAGDQTIAQALNFKSGSTTRVGGWGSKTTTLTLSGDLAFEDGASFVIDDSLAGSGTAITVNITGAATGGTFTLNSGSKAGTLNIEVADGVTRTIDSVFAGSGGTLKKSGAGTLVLTGTNTFTGKLLISGGLVELGSTSALGGSAVSVEVATGGTLDLKGKTDDKDYGNYVLSGGALINTGSAIGNNKKQLAGGITLNADSTVGGTHNFGMIPSQYAANTLTLNGHTLTKTGTNEFFLANTTVTAGTIDIQGGSITIVENRPSNGSAATFNVGNAGTLTLSNTAFSVASITTEGNGTINLGGGTLTLLGDSTIRRITSAGTVAVSDEKTLTLEGGSFNTAAFSVGTNAKIILAGDTEASIQNVISGVGSLEKIGAGAKALSGANTFEGGVTISGGKLVASNNSALGAAAGSVKISGGQLEISSSVKLAQTNITIALSDAYSTAAAILGTGALADGTKITLTAAEESVISTLVDQVTKTYQIFENGSSLAASVSADSFTLDNEAWAGWKISGYDTSSGVITLTIPEPSAFGLLAGVGALVFVAARRRCRAK